MAAFAESLGPHENTQTIQNAFLTTPGPYVAPYVPWKYIENRKQDKESGRKVYTLITRKRELPQVTD